MSDHDQPCDAARQMLPDAPASVAKVLCTLENHRPMTNKDLQQATGLPRRTLYSALRKLEQEGLVRHQVSLRDTRQTYFWLEGGVSAAS